MKINTNNGAGIVISSQATPRERFAAEELQKYIEKIIGTKLSVVDDAHSFNEQQIIIGGPARNRAARELIGEEEFDTLVPGPEGILIQSVGENRLLIAGSEGSCERGTIYAVYEFLERYLGCSLSAYSHPDQAAGEWIPRLEELVLEDISYIKPGADRPFRGACVQYGDAAGNSNHQLNLVFYEWLIKNRYNYVFTWTSTYERLKELGLVEEINRRGLEFMVGHHDAADLFMPPEGNQYFPEKYYETHPEYFKLLEDGTRFKIKDHWGQIVFCCRNMELIEQISRNMIHWLSMNPGVKMIQLAPHDGKSPQCVCEKCKPYSKSENYTFFMNEIAKRVSAVYPDVKMVQMIYVDLWECPEGVELSPSVMVMEATWHDCGLRTAGKADGGSLIGTAFEENLLNWGKTGAEMIFYDYYMGVYQNRQRYIPMADEIQSIWKRFAEKGISGALTQIECFNLWNHLFNFYTFGRTAYDSGLSMDDNLDRFVRIFGNGGKWVKKVICMAEECLDGQIEIMSSGLYLIRNIDKKTCYEYYERALNEAETPLARNNVRLMRMVFRYTDLESQEKDADSIKYQVARPYPDINPELLYMTGFDSFWKNDPGYGISIPVTGEDEGAGFDARSDRWYCFE